MPNLRTGRKCSHNTHMVMNRFVDWCHLCGAIRVKRYTGTQGRLRVVKTNWITPPARKREAVAHLLSKE